MALALLRAFLFAATASCSGPQDAAPAWKCVQRIEMPGVQGRIDHLALDPSTNRLYVAALANGSLEILDLGEGRRIGSLDGLAEPQGVAVFPERGLVAVTTGGDGELSVVDVRDPAAPKVVHRTHVGGDADNLRLDAKAGRLYAGVEGALVAVDTKDWSVARRIDLSGHAEAFQLEAEGPRIFVNVPSARHVAVIDRVEGRVTGTWSLEDSSANYPMALDEENGRLFLGCRRPAEVVVLRTADGRVLAHLPCAGDTDDLFLDRRSGLWIASCGAGHLALFRLAESGGYEALPLVPTAKGARTSLLVPESRRIHLAVPRADGRSAEVQVLEVPEAPSRDR